MLMRLFFNFGSWEEQFLEQKGWEVLGLANLDYTFVLNLIESGERPVTLWKKI